MGIEIPIETCQIFPPMDEQEKVYVSAWDSDAALEKDVKNYVRRQSLAILCFFHGTLCFLFFYFYPHAFVVFDRHCMLRSWMR